MNGKLYKQIIKWQRIGSSYWIIANDPKLGHNIVKRTRLGSLPEKWRNFVLYSFFSLGDIICELTFKNWINIKRTTKGITRNYLLRREYLLSRIVPNLLRHRASVFGLITGSLLPRMIRSHIINIFFSREHMPLWSPPTDRPILSPCTTSEGGRGYTCPYSHNVLNQVYLQQLTCCNSFWR